MVSSSGFSAGYGFLNMNEVNKDLEDSEGIFSSVGAYTTSPDEIKGGLFLVHLSIVNQSVFLLVMDS